jgi:hypothetical protein
LAPAGGRLLLESASALADHLALNPSPGSPCRLAVIVDADALSVQAANRLLKTLEEPPARARVLLSTSRPAAMLETILSRCVRWRLPPPPPAATAGLVAARLAAAGRPALSAGAMEELLRRAALAPGAALRLAGLGGEGEQPALDFALLHGARTPAAVVHAAEQLGREAGRDVASLLAAWEVDLNRRYRRVIAARAAGTSRDSGDIGIDVDRDLDAATLAGRRDLLSRAKRLAVGGQVPLNGQLALEALGFAAVAAESPRSGPQGGRRSAASAGGR